MKLVQEKLNIKPLNELKSDDIFMENKKHFEGMIKSAMRRFNLSKDVAVMMLSRGLERAASDMD